MNIRQANSDNLYDIAVFLDDCWREVYRNIVSDDFLDAMLDEERHKAFVKRYDEGSPEFLMMLDKDRLMGAGRNA